MHELIITWQTLYGEVTSPDGRQKWKRENVASFVCTYKVSQSHSAYKQNHLV